jgi:hypothetical protein
MKKMVIWTFAISALLFLGSSNDGFAQEKEQITVTVTGQGSLENNTSDKAEKEALKSAFQIAIEQGLGTFIKSETEIANFALVKDKIISKSEGYILSYKKLRKWDDGKILNVKIKAVLSLKQIGDDFRAMLKSTMWQIDNPVVAFVLTAWETKDATGLKKHLESQILIDAFQEQFKNKGFDIKAVDGAREFANTGTGKLAQVASGGRKAIAKYARESRANFVVRGELNATPKGVDAATGAYKWSGTVSGEIIDAGTGEVVASYSNTVVKLFPDKTQGLSALMHSAAKNAAKTLAKQTLETWQQYAGSGRVYNIIVKNVTSCRKQGRVIRKIIDKACEIRNSYCDREKQVWAADVIFKGSAQDLEDLIFDDEALEPFDDFDIVKKEGNHITFSF